MAGIGIGPNNELAGSEAPLARLRAHFETSALEAHPQKWDDLWEKKDFLPWDRAKPSPALVDALRDRVDLLGPAQVNGRKKRALVPGCGRGYDVLLMAEMGYDAVGLEVSENAIAAAHEFAKSTTEYDIKDGSYTFVKGDFFKNDWLEAAGSSPDKGFDLIYDYTFLCALPQDARPAWSRRMSELLAKSSDARLVCLEFPTAKDPASGGPPFGLSPDVYVAHLSHPGEKLSYTSQGYPEPSYYSAESVEKASKDLALTRIAHFKPARTHKAGEGNDTMSIWQHKQ